MKAIVNNLAEENDTHLAPLVGEFVDIISRGKELTVIDNYGDEDEVSNVYLDFMDYTDADIKSAFKNTKCFKNKKNESCITLKQLLTYLHKIDHESNL